MQTCYETCLLRRCPAGSGEKKLLHKMFVEADRPEPEVRDTLAAFVDRLELTITHPSGPKTYRLRLAEVA